VAGAVEGGGDPRQGEHYRLLDKYAIKISAQLYRMITSEFIIKYPGTC
jgi:hypothetical protein